jgi:Asp-tRNA(Asn)/Glu-tRNA(Gln) amidotransferase A subunit family amidase
MTSGYNIHWININQIKMMNTNMKLLWMAVLITAIVISCKMTGVKVTEKSNVINTVTITEAQKLTGLGFDTMEQRLMEDNLGRNLRYYEMLRQKDLENSVPYALVFKPLERPVPRGQEIMEWDLSGKNIKRPERETEIAFMSVAGLSELIRTRQLSSVELTKLFINRIKRYNDSLLCCVTLTEELALRQAEKADKEIAEGRYRGPLHGIPYGIKDLFAVPGYKTTWGAGPYKTQVINETATVVRKLEEAGAVLVAKLSMGALAMGDLWFGGRTRNPWNTKLGSSGSSAGSASATSAGLVAFAIGTETVGSIVSPSRQCGVTGLRPTFGRVSRYGAMTLSWSMDKVGPICRSAEDCAIIFNVIRGEDPKDLSTVDRPFNFKSNTSPKNLKGGYFKGAFDTTYDNRYSVRQNDLDVLKKFNDLGVELKPVDLFFKDIPVEALNMIVSAEAAAAFDDLTRSNRDSLLTSQGKGAWPNIFRSARFIPAVEYIQANRYRYLLAQQMDLAMKEFDFVITPIYGGNILLITNLTGNPCVTVPNGFTKEGIPTSISFIGNLYDEANILAVADIYQKATGFNKLHPPSFSR